MNNSNKYFGNFQGFSVENQENLQEVLTRQLYVCQCYIALNILKSNGHFVVKLFDLFTSFSVGLIYLMSRCFQKSTEIMKKFMEM